MLDLFGSFVVGLGLQKEFPAPLCVTGSTDILIVIASIFCSGAIKSVYSPGCTKSCRILAYLRDVNEIDLQQIGNILDLFTYYGLLTFIMIKC